MPALYDPAERIKAQDADSVSAEVLYRVARTCGTRSSRLERRVSSRSRAPVRTTTGSPSSAPRPPNRLIGGGQDSFDVGRIDDSAQGARCAASDELHLRGAVLDAWPSDGAKARLIPNLRRDLGGGQRRPHAR